MNWKIIASGFFLIFLVFFSYLTFQFINERQNRTEIVQPQPTFIPTDISPERQLKLIEQEANTYKQLVRGRVSRYNQETNTFTVAMEVKKASEGLNVVGVVDIQIDQDRVSEFLCWPEFNVTSGGDRIDMKKAFIPMGQDSVLYLTNETKKPIDEVDQYLNQSPYVYANLATQIENIDEFINNAGTLPPQNLDQLAILGCDETN